MTNVKVMVIVWPSRGCMALKRLNVTVHFAIAVDRNTNIASDQSHGGMYLVDSGKSY